VLAMRHADAKSPTLQLFSNSSQIFSATSIRFSPYSSFSLFLLSSPLRLQLLRTYSNQSNRRTEPHGASSGLAWPGRTQDHAAELGGVSEKAQTRLNGTLRSYNGRFGLVTSTAMIETRQNPRAISSNWPL